MDNFRFGMDTSPLPSELELLMENFDFRFASTKTPSPIPAPRLELVIEKSGSVPNHNTPNKRMKNLAFKFGKIFLTTTPRPLEIGFGYGYD